MTQHAVEHSIVIPMKDEAENVAPMLRELRDVMDGVGDYEIVVVDDGSTDATWERLQELKTEIPPLRTIRFARNAGQSAGFWAGLRRARGRILIMMDGDMQNDPHDIPKLLDELRKGADVCLTWRRARQDSRMKKMQSRIGNAVRNWLLRSDVRDTGSQLRAFYAHCIEDLPCFNGMHRFMGNLFLMRGCRVVQIPTHHRGRNAGRTKYGLGNRALRGLRDLLGVRWLTDRDIRYEVTDRDA